MKEKKIKEGKVKFVTPVVFATTPELGDKGLVIVDLEQLRNAQKEHEKELNLLLDRVEKEVGEDEKELSFDEWKASMDKDENQPLKQKYQNELRADLRQKIEEIRKEYE